MSLAVAIGMILAALFLLRSEWEKLQLETGSYLIRTGKPVKGSKKTPEGKDRLRLLFMSDLHEYLPAVHTPEKIVSVIDGAEPDVILIGGDMITVSKHRKQLKPETGTALRLISLLTEKYPVYYGEGNHENRLRERDPEAYGEYVAALIGCGVRYLSDMSVPLKRGPSSEETGVMVTGITLEDAFYRPSPGFGLKACLPEGYLPEKSGEPDRSKFQILLLHHPAFLKEAAEAGYDLVLSGHMHGGTVRLPGGRGLMTPQYRFLVRECSGIFSEKDATMVVSPGLGTHSIKIRFNDLPELTLIDIVQKDGHEGTDQL